MIQHAQLTSKEIHDELHTVDKAHLSLHAHGCVLRNEMVYHVLIEVASENVGLPALSVSFWN